MPDEIFRTELFEQFARLGQALSSRPRVETIYILSQGEKTVEQVARAARISVANASHHLQRLKDVRMVASRKQGQHVFYRLASPTVETFWQCLQAIGEDRLLEVRELIDTYMLHRDELEAVTREELLKKIARNEVVIIDVRPEDEYHAGHLPQALSIPPEALEARINELPKDKEIVAYCRGPYCLISYDAVAVLRMRGFNAIRLEDGFPEWKAGNLPFETGDQSAP